MPRLCESFSELNPVQITGGEQTLFALTADGKVSIELADVVVIVTPYDSDLYDINLPRPSHAIGLCLGLRCVRPTWSRRDREHCHAHCRFHPCDQGRPHQEAVGSLRGQTLPRRHCDRRALRLGGGGRWQAGPGRNNVSGCRLPYSGFIFFFCGQFSPQRFEDFMLISFRIIFIHCSQAFRLGTKHFQEYIFTESNRCVTFSTSQ